MNDKEEMTENESATDGETTANRKRSNKKLIIIAVSFVVVVAAFGVWRYWQSGRSGEGQTVPAPRNVSFNQSDNSNAGQTLSEATVTLAPEQVSRTGIKIETVGEQFSKESGTTVSTGVVQPNAYRETPVLSLVGGIVRRVDLQLGQRVRRGQTVAVVFSEELAATQSRYVSLLTEVETSRQSYERQTKLVNINPVTRAELEQATARLKTAEAELNEHHKHHERTMKLVRIGAASREELEQATTKLKTAEADVEEARTRYERAVKLVEINPVARTEFEQAVVKLRSMESELAAERQKLLLLGLSSQRVDALKSAKQICSELEITAPISGTVTSRNVNQGEVVEANKELVRVTDLSSVWVVGQVYEKDLAKIRVGSGASITTDAYAGKVFRGQISYLDPRLDANTRTAQVRVELANPNQELKLGMYVKVAFATITGAENTTPIVPTAAVQNINNQQVVFIPTDNPNTFTMRPVRLGAETNGHYAVLEGLNVGDKIVTEGSFLLRAEWLKLNPSGVSASNGHKH
jgi:RND family efflux transporter MFP subunit